ncbi:hypothetical protein ACFX1Z_019194 [Malus domestica]
MRQNPGTANAMATKMYEERLKLPLQRDSMDDASMKQRFGDNVGQILDQSHASILKSAVATGQPSGQVLHGTAGDSTSPSSKSAIARIYTTVAHTPISSQSTEILFRDATEKNNPTPRKRCASLTSRAPLSASAPTPTSTVHFPSRRYQPRPLFQSIRRRLKAPSGRRKSRHLPRCLQHRQRRSPHDVGAPQIVQPPHKLSHHQRIHRH